MQTTQGTNKTFYNRVMIRIKLFAVVILKKK